MNYFERFKERWEVKSNFQLLIICIVFAVTGSASVYVAKPILAFLSITKESLNPWGYYPLRILIIFPCYQILLLVIGTLFGQFKFFWTFEKKTLGRFMRKK